MTRKDFNPKTFETLSGLDLADYAVRVMQEGVAENVILPYFENRAATRDMPHLELAVGILDKVGSDRAYQIVAGYLDHADFNVRFVATKIVARMALVDERMMQRIVDCLSMYSADPAALAHELKALLDHPSNPEAGRIASEYKAHHKLP